jgi:serine/threonine protein kinase
MADKTERLNNSPKGTDRLQKENTLKLAHDAAGRLDAENKNIFPVYFKNGDLIKSRYEVVDRLGKPSGEAIVYLCKDTKNNSNVVVKLYHQGFSAKEEIIKMLVNITHEDIINVIDYGYEQEQFYEVMEFAAGGTLQDRLRKKFFSEEELTKLVIPEVLNGLVFCHENRIIHRDIKPTNIFYRDIAQKDIVLGDFGISSVLEQGFSVRKTKSALTIEFAAPELFGSEEHYVSKESDYYALGITLMWLYLGRNPFDGLSQEQIMFKHASERIMPPDTMSDRFKSLISGLLVKVRKERWGADHIERWLKGKDVPVYEDSYSGVALNRIPPFPDSEMATNDIKKLAIMFQSHKASKKVMDRLRQGLKPVSSWLIRFDQDMADKVSEIEERVKNPDFALLEISCILDPNVPYFFTPEQKVESPVELASLIDQNWELGKEHFQSGRIAIWLKYTPGGEDILKRWNGSTLGVRNTNNSDVVLESFLHCLNPLLQEARALIEPPALNIGTIESIASIQRKVKITNNGSRGLLSCMVSLNSDIEGLAVSIDNTNSASKLKSSVEVATSGEQGKDIINLLPGESSQIQIKIDASLVPRFAQTYNVAITLTKNTFTFRDDYQETIEIPISFYVDYPAYSKKKAKSQLIV